MRLPNNSAGIVRNTRARQLWQVEAGAGVLAAGYPGAHFGAATRRGRPGVRRRRLPLASPDAGPLLWGIDCGCWEDPASGTCVDFSCTCDDPFSCFALEVGCAITGGDWGGWDDDECTW